VKPVPNKAAYFEVLATPEGLPQITIGQYRDSPRYIHLRSTIQFSPQHQAIYNRLSSDEQGKLGAYVALELSRSSVAFDSNLPESKVEFTKRVPVTRLTEDKFINALDQFTNARLAVNQVLAVSFYEAGQKTSSLTTRSV
jgi:hypothetical protein